MALRGNLRDFSLPDVFQLITFSKKTGVLRIVRQDDAQGSVWFRDGEAFFASSNWHAHPLGARLVEAHRITPQALNRALDIRKSEGPEGRRLGMILVDEGYITREVLETFVQDQIQDTIFDLMRWDDGEFDFEAMPEVEEEDIGLTVSIENVVMEGSRRLEEWNRIKRKIPSTDIVFKMATAPGEGTFEISLKPMEWQLLLLIDATRSVAELAVATARTDFEVARVVYGLFSAGLLEFATDEEVARHRAERERREQRLAEVEAQAAARRKADESAALEREAALAEQARARQQVQADVAEPVVAVEVADVLAQPVATTEPTPVSAAPVAPGVAESTSNKPVEVPEFLGSPQSNGGADEQVLDAFMGALLGEAPAQEPEPQVPTPVPSTPYVPGEVPAFMGAAPVLEDEADTVATVADLLGIDAHAVAEPEMAAPVPQPAAVLAPEPVIPAETEPQPMVAPVPGPVISLEPEPQPTLIPEPVAAPPITPEPVVAPPAVAFEPQPVFAPDVVVDDVALVGSESQVASVAGLLADASESTLIAESAAETGLVDLGAADEIAFSVEDFISIEEPADASETAVQDSGYDALAAIAADLDLLTDDAELVADQAPVLDEFTVAEAQAPTVEPLVLDAPAQAPRRIAEPASIVGAAPDEATSTGGFAANLMALGLGELETPVEPSGPQEDFDADLLAEISGETEGVISTDSFMTDFDAGDLGLSGGLSDEISALTGVERKTTSHRPRANVNPITDGAGAVLKRDARVDRDTLLKIIDGVKNL